MEIDWFPCSGGGRWGPDDATRPSIHIAGRSFVGELVRILLYLLQSIVISVPDTLTVWLFASLCRLVFGDGSSLE